MKPNKIKIRARWNMDNGTIPGHYRLTFYAGREGFTFVNIGELTVNKDELNLIHGMLDMRRDVDWTFKDPNGIGTDSTDKEGMTKCQR